MADRTRTLVAVAWLLVAAPLVAEGPGRVVAIGDIHGALEPLRTILREVELIDTEDRWIGGTATLVQTGDVLDRGSKVREVVALLRDLQEQAPRSGGRVIVLLGNHEALNLVHDLRDVDERIVRHFAAKNTDARRIKFCEEKIDALRARARRAGTPPPDRVAGHARCLESTPKGWLEYVAALGPGGELGGWLRTLPAAARVGDLLFVHGGVAPELDLDAEAINARVAEEIATFDATRAELLDRGLIFEDSQLVEIYAAARALLDARRRALDRSILELPSWLLIAPEGPLWFRGYSRWEEPEGMPAMRRIVDERGVDAVIVGHTPRGDQRIQPRFGGRAYLIDTGMLESVYGGRPSALEFAGERVTAVYVGDREVLRDTAADERRIAALD